jgi:hypothetical protein
MQMAQKKEVDFGDKRQLGWSEDVKELIGGKRASSYKSQASHQNYLSIFMQGLTGYTLRSFVQMAVPALAWDLYCLDAPERTTHLWAYPPKYSFP